LREIQAQDITKKVKELFLKANYETAEDILETLEEFKKKESSPTGQSVLEQIMKNNAIAKKEQVAICQDTGVGIVFIDYGQEVHVVGGNLTDAVNEGVRQAYKDGYLRKSVVNEPLFERKNTGDNTPAVIHTTIVPGETFTIEVNAKGFGGENMSAIKLYPPSAGIEGAKKYIVDTVLAAGANSCPPVIVGVGIGGTTEKAFLLAKKAMMRPCGEHHPDPRYAQFEKEVLDEINKLGIGPAGLGGNTTALCVNVEYFPTHIASIPVAVNLSCHASRHAKGEL
jgi:fumarate hydratase subunit alpha